MDQGEQQSVKRSRPKPRPRPKKSKETTEEHGIVESDPMPETTAGKGKVKGKQKTATAASSEAKSTRKRKSPTGDDTGDNLPSKRKRADPTAIHKSANKPEAVATRQTTAEDVKSFASDETAASDQLGTIRALGQCEEGTNAEAKAPAKDARTKSTMEPTRRQPSRAASKKDISALE
jgi:hypothetical protein